MLGLGAEWLNAWELEGHRTGSGRVDDPFGSGPVAESDCVFCRIVAGEVPATIVHQDERTVAFLDIAPATRGRGSPAPPSTSPMTSRPRRASPSPSRPISSGVRRRPSEILRIAREFADGVPTARLARELGCDRTELITLRRRLDRLAPFSTNKTTA